MINRRSKPEMWKIISNNITSIYVQQTDIQYSLNNATKRQVLNYAWINDESTYVQIACFLKSNKAAYTATALIA